MTPLKTSAGPWLPPEKTIYSCSGGVGGVGGMLMSLGGC